VVDGALGPAGVDRAQAAADRRPREGGAGIRRRHRRGPPAVPRLLRDRRRHDGVRESGERAIRAIFERIVGTERGAELSRLSTATIRAVAQGVVGVAFIQAIVVGVCLLVAGIPWAGVLAVVVLVLGIAQIPALVVTLPAIA
jgi:hypothetical protein